MTKKQAGKLGGRATVKKYGKDYMAALARKGGRTLHEKYKLVPVNGNDFILVHRETGKTSGKTIHGRSTA